MKRSMIDVFWVPGTPGHAIAMRGEIYRAKVARYKDQEAEALRLRNIHAGASPLPRGFACFS